MELVEKKEESDKKKKIRTEEWSERRDGSYGGVMEREERGMTMMEG